MSQAEPEEFIFLALAHLGWSDWLAAFTALGQARRSLTLRFTPEEMRLIEREHYPQSRTKEATTP